MVKNQPANAGDTGLIPRLGRSPGEGNGNSIFLPWEIPLTEEPSRLRSIGSQKSWTQLTDQTMTSYINCLIASSS